MHSFKGKLIPFLLLVVLTFCSPRTVKASTLENDPTEILQKWLNTARDQYDNLPEQGKFATGAVVGFTTSKIAVNSAVKLVKIAGATFVATEMLEAVGILDTELYTNSEPAKDIKNRVLMKVGDIRNSIKQKFDGKNIKKWLESDKMATLGAATGAFFGFLM